MGWGNRCGCPGRLDLLCLLALLGGCLLPVCRTRVYTNHWAVKITGGFPEANHAVRTLSNAEDYLDDEDSD